MPHLRRVRLLLHLPPLSHGLTRRGLCAGGAAARPRAASDGEESGGRAARRLYEACRRNAAAASERTSPVERADAPHPPTCTCSDAFRGPR